MEEKKPADQKNFKLGVATTRAYEDWCDGLGLDHKRTFMAGWLALVKMNAIEREAVFLELNKWEADGFAVPIRPVQPIKPAKRSGNSSTRLLGK